MSELEVVESVFDNKFCPPFEIKDILDFGEIFDRNRRYMDYLTSFCVQHSNFTKVLETKVLNLESMIQNSNSDRYYNMDYKSFTNIDNAFQEDMNKDDKHKEENEKLRQPSFVEINTEKLEITKQDLNSPKKKQSSMIMGDPKANQKLKELEDQIKALTESISVLAKKCESQQAKNQEAFSTQSKYNQTTSAELAKITAAHKSLQDNTSSLQSRLTDTIKVTEENMRNQNQKVFSLEENFMKISRNFFQSIGEIEKEMEKLKSGPSTFSAIPISNFSSTSDDSLLVSIINSELKKLHEINQEFRLGLAKVNDQSLLHDKAISGMQADLSLTKDIENNAYFGSFAKKMNQTLAEETDKLNEQLKSAELKLAFLCSGSEDKFGIINDSISSLSATISLKMHKEEFEQRIEEVIKELDTKINRNHEMIRVLEMKGSERQASPKRKTKKESVNFDNTNSNNLSQIEDNISIQNGKKLFENVNKICHEVFEEKIENFFDEYLRNSNYLNQDYKSLIVSNAQAIEQVSDTLTKLSLTVLQNEKKLDGIQEINEKLFLLSCDIRMAESKFLEVKNYLLKEFEGHKSNIKLDSDDELQTKQILSSPSHNNNILKHKTSTVGIKSTQLKDMEDRIVTLTYKVDKIMDEMSMRIKREMIIESSKIFDGFKAKLRHSIHTIEDQLQLKVDQMGLDSILKKIEKKIADELKLKIGVDDLKKNTNEISRRIDTVQSKITKTLVDTLIELQSEEAPLILKLNNHNNEKGKCVSCDQPFKDLVKHAKTLKPFKKTAGSTAFSGNFSQYIHPMSSAMVIQNENLTENNIVIQEGDLSSSNYYSEKLVKIGHQNKHSTIPNTKMMVSTTFHTNNNSISVPFINPKSSHHVISSKQLESLMIDTNYSEEKKKFSQIVSDELDRVNVNSNRIKNAANMIIEKKEKMSRKDIK